MYNAYAAVNKRKQKSNTSRLLKIGKIYGTLTNLSVLVHQINKLIVKCVIF